MINPVGYRGGLFMNFSIKTNEYYSKWIGLDGILNEEFKGVKFIYSSERNKIQNGYIQQFDILIYYQSDRIIFSYGDKSLEQIDKVKQQIKRLVTLDYLKKKNTCNTMTFLLKTTQNAKIQNG